MTQASEPSDDFHADLPVAPQADPRALVRTMAALARLSIEADEEARLADQFPLILRQFQALSELDVDGVQPMTGPLEPEDVLRDDTPRPSLTQAEALANAPDATDGYYGVPKTIGGDA